MKHLLKPDLTLTENGIESSSFAFRCKNMSPSIHKALKKRLVRGDESELTLEAEEEWIYFYYYFNSFKKLGLLTYQTPLFRLIPFNGSFSYEEAPDEKLKCSRFALCRLEGKEFVLETPLSAARVHFQSEEGLQFFSSFSKQLSLQEIQEKFPHLSLQTIQESLSILFSAKLLISKEESSVLQQWEFHDLYFHSRSRIGRLDASLGGTFRFKGILPPPASIKECNKTATLALPKPKEELTLSLGETIEKRKSIRTQGENPISLIQLGSFFYHCARVKQVRTQGSETFALRPFPGGGARYELELYPIVYRCEGLKQGVYHYHPLEHCLCFVAELDEQAEKFLTDAKKSSASKEYPQVLIVISARFQRVSWKYQSMAYALILKDLGIVYQTMYLVATAMNLAPCAIGAGDSDLFCNVMKTDYLVETSVGEFMLSSRSE